MEKLIRLLQKYGTGKVVSLLLIVTMAVYLTMLLFSIPAVISFAPDMMLFDLLPAMPTKNAAIAQVMSL